MPIDYSKWDRLDCGSDSDDDRPKPSVTAFETPQSVTINPNSRQPEIKASSSSAQGTSLTGVAAVTAGNDQRGKERVLEKPRNGAAFESEYAWDQDQTHVYFWFQLPSVCVSNQRRSERKVELVTEEPPAKIRDLVGVPEAVLASDFDESAEDGDQGLFPVAWGVKLTWPCTPPAAQTVNKLWTKVEGCPCICTVPLWFRYPVMTGESTWLWSLETDCPFLKGGDKDTRFVKIELSKKRSQSLHNVNLMWNKGLHIETENIKICRSATEQARHDAFLQAWKEAHQEFKAKVKDIKPTEIECD